MKGEKKFNEGLMGNKCFMKSSWILKQYLPVLLKTKATECNLNAK